MRLLTATFVLVVRVFACTVVDVPGHGVIGNGSSDDAAAVNALIVSNAGCTIHFQGTNTYLIDSQLAAVNHTYLVLDATATILRGGGTLGVGQIALLTNANWAGNFDIRVSGGIWDANKRGGNTRQDDNSCVEPSTTCIFQAGNSIEFINAKWIQVSNLTLNDAVVLNVLFSGCVHCEASFLTFTEPAPVLHNDCFDVYGPSSEISAHDFKGTCGDDVIAVLADDIVAGDPTTGDISDVQVFNINVTSPWNGVKLLVNSAHINNVSVQNFAGSYNSSGFGAVVDFFTNNCGTQGGTITNVMLDKFSATAATGNFILFDAKTAGPVTYSNVSGGSTTITTHCTASASPGAFAAVNVVPAQPMPTSFISGQSTLSGQATLQ